MRKPAKVIAYASTTHCRSGAVKPRLNWIDGSATLTMLRSRMTMNCATQQTPSSHGETSRRALSGCGAGEATARGAVVSTLIATRTPQPAHRTAGRVGHRAHRQDTGATPMESTPLIAV